MVHFVGDYCYFMWKMHGEDKVKMLNDVREESRNRMVSACRVQRNRRGTFTSQIGREGWQYVYEARNARKWRGRGFTVLNHGCHKMWGISWRSCSRTTMAVFFWLVAIKYRLHDARSSFQQKKKIITLPQHVQEGQCEIVTCRKRADGSCYRKLRGITACRR
jgi:hypothetical protein